ncbi:MAG: P-loop NTPase fold protein [Candidatus Desulfatibia sp.]|uniref:P-loop NTPase fold protein n=1 Tax=Candidatus Desulfatibia sp. TaxID=3101189 RepID=UPI002F33BDE0
MLKKAKNISEVPSAFPPAPLKGEEFQEFYVPVDSERDACLSRIEELKKKLEKDNVKILFAGHRGSGKSTELNRLIMESAETDFTVKFSVTEELDVNDINYIDLVMTMMEQIADQAEKAGFIDKDSKHLQKITDWLSDVTEIKATETGYMLEVEAGLKASRGMLSSLIGLIAEFKAAVKSASVNKKEYRKKLDQKISLLTAYCNIMINEIKINLQKQNKNLLVVIEDLDKVETSKTHELFFKHSGILTELNAKIVFTVSVFTLTTPYLADLKSRFELVSLPMLKTKKIAGGVYDRGVAVIKKIVENRAELTLFETGVLDQMIDRCGGVLRDLFEMIDIAATSASFNKLDTIDRQISDYAFERLKSRYHGMITVEGKEETGVTTDSLYDELVKISQSEAKKFPLDKTILLLLSCLAVVEYNGEQWFDVHPVVKSLLKDMGKI